MRERLTDTEEGLRKSVEMVEMSIKEFIISIISRLKETGISYGELGKLINVDKGTVKKLLDGTWYPKTKRAETKLLANVCKIKQRDLEVVKDEKSK